MEDHTRIGAFFSPYVNDILHASINVSMWQWFQFLKEFAFIFSHVFFYRRSIHRPPVKSAVHFNGVDLRVCYIVSRGQFVGARTGWEN